MDILSHFNLRDNPFRLTQEPEMFFPQSGHRAVLTGVAYALMRGDGLLKLVGAVGTGKTMTVRLLAGMLSERFNVAYVGCADGEEWPHLLRKICRAYKITPEGDDVDDWGGAFETSLVRTHAAHRRTLLILDEAQNLEPRNLRRMSLLSDLEQDGRPLVQILIVGQPELNQILKRPGLQAVAQRISFEFTTAPLSSALVGAYIQHRLRMVSQDRFRQTPMSDWAIRLIAKLSGGIPRLIHLLADKSLFAAFADGRNEVVRRDVIIAAREMDDLQLNLSFVYRYNWGRVAVLLILASTAFFSGIAAVWAFAGRLPGL